MTVHTRTPRILGTAIVFFALLQGILVGQTFFPGASRGHFALRLASTGAISLILTSLLILRRLADRRLKTEQDLLEMFLQSVPYNIFFKDRNSRFIRISRNMAKYFGQAHPDEAVGKADSDIFSSEHAVKALADEQEILRTGVPKVGIEERETWPDGREGWVLTTKMPLRDRRGAIVGTMGISHDITDRKQAEARIHHMALHDALTGLPNRFLLQDRLTQAVALACRNQKQIAVLMLDLDRFKTINDSLGHHIGDHLLEAVSARLKGCLRKSDMVARFGGDEFVIVLPMADDGQHIEQVAQKILDTLVEPFQIEGHELQIGTSIGISQYPKDGESPETLLQAADTAMYEAKGKGRGTFCFFSPQLNEDTRRRQVLEKDLRMASARDEFVVHYQPLVSADSGSITGVEALLRWRHPQHGLISPGQFIPLLEELGLMTEVGRWVLLTACRQNVAWQREGLPAVRVTVNVSAQQFHRGNIVAAVEEVLHETGLNPKWLELELTESLTLDGSDATIRIMHDLKRTGASLSLDDFGTGWSSLSCLRRFPLDRLKIDRSFMRDVISQPAAEAVVRSIMGLAHNLGLECIGDGVETEQQLHYLQAQMCSEIQGFLYSPAVPAAECGRLLGAGKAAFADSTAKPANSVAPYEQPLFAIPAHA